MLSVSQTSFPPNIRQFSPRSDLPTNAEEEPEKTDSMVSPTVLEDDQTAPIPRLTPWGYWDFIHFLTKTSAKIPPESNIYPVIDIDNEELYLFKTKIWCRANTPGGHEDRFLCANRDEHYVSLEKYKEEKSDRYIFDIHAYAGYTTLEDSQKQLCVLCRMTLTDQYSNLHLVADQIEDSLLGIEEFDDDTDPFPDHTLQQPDRRYFWLRADQDSSIDFGRGENGLFLGEGSSDSAMVKVVKSREHFHFDPTEDHCCNEQN